MHQLIVWAMPVFGVLMGVEFVYGLLTGRNTYRLNDAISSLSQGLLSQVVAVCTQLFQIGLYAMAFPHLAWVHDAALWHSWPGWLLAVLLFDFCDYWLHRVGHESAIFWAAHVVHHQSQCFNLSTALRQESAYALLGWMFYLPMAVAGVPPELYGMAGLVVLLYQFWIHTEHVGKLGWFDRVFSSPSNHRVHHAVNERYIDKNYGAILVLWDRLFGTFEAETEPCVYGTRAPLDSWDPLWAVAQVYSTLLKQVWQTRGWRDKLRVLLKAPGWQPPAQARPEPPFRLDAVRRFDPPISAAQRWAATAGFVVAVGAVGIFLWRADELAFSADVLVALCLTASLWGVGSMLGGRLGAWSGSLLSAGAAALAVWLI